ncbi:hypothetical protein HXX76_014470 [Chlamydomonas incerta]|uniref:Hypoxanthine phosphoribosyltransferase n=1 Tax=Chlamydomonas incerta TaxID=51695 RepID=A0A835SBU7_CHLIN|nr:hypothetical protein HXX76_014470 [Chlamydomonas incerta]|eukprot:KAG2424417.1 hypothetical protein HXX76_014470 [Chlamydomonas incerta]
MELLRHRGSFSRTGLRQAQRRGVPVRSLGQPVPQASQPPHSRPHPHPRPLPLHPEISKIIFSAEEIDARVAELGRLVGTDYSDRELLVLGVLKGAFAFTSDLVRHIYPYPPSLEVDFFKASSYGSGTVSSGRVQLDSGFKLDSVRGKHVLLVEDIIDTGNTLSALVAVMKGAGAASVRVCALLDKKARRRVPMEAEYTGFECPDEFIVGYGIDYAEKYRNLPYIGAVKDEFIKK